MCVTMYIQYTYIYNTIYRESNYLNRMCDSGLEGAFLQLRFDLALSVFLLSLLNQLRSRIHEIMVMLYSSNRAMGAYVYI